MSVAVVHDTKGAGLEALAKRLKRLAAGRVLIGVPKGKETLDGESLALRAARVEFGAGHSPERPFLRGGIRDGLPKFKAIAEHDARAVAEDRMSPQVALERLGVAGAGHVKEYMAGPNFVPNAPSTIAKKGSSQPTIDTSAVRQAITHVVEEGAL